MAVYKRKRKAPGSRPRKVQKPGAGGRLARAKETARLHKRLAEAVLTGQLRECAWKTLKTVYFGGSTEQAAVDQLVRWADKHGIELEAKVGRIGPIVAYFVRFKIRD